MAYPATKTTFTTIGTANKENESGYSHRARHNDKQTLLESIEDTLGTTGGTSVLKNFVAGDFAARVASETLTSPTIAGTVGGTSVFSAFPECAGTPDANNELANKQYVDAQAKAVAAGTTLAQGTTAGTVYANLGSVIATTTVTSNVEIHCFDRATSNNAGSTNYHRILRGTTNLSSDIYDSIGTSAFFHPICITEKDLSLAAGTYTYNWQWQVAGGTATASSPKILVIAHPA